MAIPPGGTALKNDDESVGEVVVLVLCCECECCSEVCV